MPEEPIAQLARRRLQADVLLCRVLGDIIAIAMKLQVALARQSRDESLIRIGFCPAQLVIEMNDREDNPELASQLKQQPQKRNRINATGNGHADAIPGPQQFLPPNKGKHALRR